MRQTRSAPPRGRSDGGLSLLEVAVAIAILTTISFLLIGAIAASQKMKIMVRERATAYTAIRSYVEQMRATTLTAISLDLNTPVDFLPSPNPLRSAQGAVYKILYENGTGGLRVTNAYGALGTSAALTSFTDGANLAFTSGGRDLNGNGNTTDNPATAVSLVVLPVMVTISWTVASGGVETATAYVCFGKP